MLQETLIPGLKFAEKHELTQRDMSVLVFFLERPYTATELSEVMKMNRVTLYEVIRRLKWRNLLDVKDKDSKGNILYRFNAELLE